MPDAALSVTASPLAALLSRGKADSAPTAAKTGADPFAALLASTTMTKKGDAPVATGTADAVAALLASAAPVAPAPVAPVAIATTVPTMPVSPIAAEALPADPETAALPKIKVKAKTEDETADADSDDKDDDSGDALADAIASGATAVLALAPTIVAPVQPPVPDPVAAQTPVRIDAPMTPKVLKPLTLAGGPTLNGPGKTKEEMPVVTRAQTAADAAALPQADASAPRTDPNAQQQQQSPQQDKQPAQTAEAKPAAVQLPPEVAKAVVAALKQSDTNPATVAQPNPAVTADAAPVVQTPVQQQVQVQQAQQQAAPVQPARPTRRSDEAAAVAPRRAGDARRRSDVTATDLASAGFAQRVQDAQPTISRPVTDIQAKGDQIVEQTLTIARDGAWLDKLAHDIASAGSGNDLHFKLAPENLGALSVAISQKDDGASIRLTADNQQTRDILVDAQPKLIAEARAQGLKVSDTQVDVRQDNNSNQNQSASQDSQRWAQQQAGQQNASQNGQNRQSSPDHKPFVSNLARKAEAESESASRDSDALYA